MPTENRSSNTDPRDVLIRLNPLGLGEAELRKDSTGFEDQRTHGDYLLFLAGYRESHPEPLQHTEQHQGEPVAWRGINELGEVVTEWIDGAPPSSMVDLSGNPASFARIERAYTHADPNVHWKAVADEQMRVIAELRDEIDGIGGMREKLSDMTHARNLCFDDTKKLRAQLAERDALLRDVHGAMRKYEQGCDQFPPFHHNRLMERIDASLLSASAEPSAPGVLPRAHDVNMFQRTAQPGAKS